MRKALRAWFGHLQVHRSHSFETLMFATISSPKFTPFCAFSFCSRAVFRLCFCFRKWHFLCRTQTKTLRIHVFYFQKRHSNVFKTKSRHCFCGHVSFMTILQLKRHFYFNCSIGYVQRFSSTPIFCAIACCKTARRRFPLNYILLGLLVTFTTPFPIKIHNHFELKAKFFLSDHLWITSFGHGFRHSVYSNTFDGILFDGFPIRFNDTCGQIRNCNFIWFLMMKKGQHSFFCFFKTDYKLFF